MTPAARPVFARGRLTTPGRTISIIQPGERLDVPVRATRNERETNEWTLVLAAEGIELRVDAVGDVFVLLVAERDARRARTALDAYDEETARGAPAPSPRTADALGWPTPAADDDLPAAALDVAWTTAVGTALLLIGFFAVTGPAADATRWFERGAASAAGIVGGEPWRAVTALTLHVDAVHVAGNALAVAVLLQPLVTRLGPGGGVLLMLLAGAGGNVLAALVHDPRHVAVGASTATFGAIGALAALRLLSPSRPPRSRRWIVVGASLALLAMLGTGEGADVLGHALGLVAGAALGFVVAVSRPVVRTSLGLGLPGAAAARPWRHGAVQLALLALAALLLIGCWRLALAG